MKKLAMLLLGVSMSFMSTAQTMEKSYYNNVSGADTGKLPIKKSHSITNGKTPYIYAGVGASMPTYSYGYSFEAGMWGIESLTSFGLVADIGYGGSKYSSSSNYDSISISNKMTHWLGIKWYQTFYQTKTSCYMAYLSPKISLEKNENGNYSGLMEIGINPNYTINKHMLMSVSLYNQIFKLKQFNPGISVGLVIYR
jgi:hypothetical protein